MRRAGGSPHGLRTRAPVVLLGGGFASARPRAESDLDRSRGAVSVRHGKGGKRREVGMDPWGWEQLGPWLERRLELPVGALLCIITGPTADDRGRAPPPATRSDIWPPTPVSVAASRRISSAARTPSRWPAKECR